MIIELEGTYLEPDARIMAGAAAGEALGNRPRAADVVNTVGAGATGAGLLRFLPKTQASYSRQERRLQLGDT
ncbi:hypothetical protein N5P37_001705 [Trichoderma harzianum]|nr:hypothetical protein N5P37_001705 [Trichoderma harzianum]